MMPETRLEDVFSRCFWEIPKDLLFVDCLNVRRTLKHRKEELVQKLGRSFPMELVVAGVKVLLKELAPVTKGFAVWIER
jgi:hypothetical protein